MGGRFSHLAGPVNFIPIVRADAVEAVEEVGLSASAMMQLHAHNIALGVSQGNRLHTGGCRCA